MTSTRSVHGGPKPPARLRRRFAAGAVALGVLSVAGVGGLASPAVAQAPTVVIECKLDAQNDGRPLLVGRLSDFPGDEPYFFFGVFREGGGRTSVVNSFPFSTSATGTYSTVGGPFGLPPFRVGIAIFRDRNGNFAWDPDADDTVYRGDGTVTSCPQNVTLSPK